MSCIELHCFAELKGAKEDINIGIELVTREKAVSCSQVSASAAECTLALGSRRDFL